MYQSEFTRFINGFLQQHPEVNTERRELRLTWWDRQVDLDALARYREAKVPQKPYVYQPE